MRLKLLGRKISKSISVVFLLSFFSLFLIACAKPAEGKDANTVFSETIASVLELKCEKTNPFSENVLSYGTAVIYDEDGYLLTNCHVVTIKKGDDVVEYEAYYVRFAFEENYRKAELLSLDRDLDLAILRFIELPQFELQPIKIGSADNLKSGDVVYAMGNALNLGITITKGIIGIPVVNISYSNQMKKLIQSDVVITDGNSGGALLDGNGYLVGITTSRMKDANNDIVHGIAYSVPVNLVEEFMSERR